MGDIKNILTVDVEDWYMNTDISRWEKFEDRVVDSTERILSILGDTKATFFVLGYVAEHHPELISLIHARGHELGTHGYSHKPIQSQTPDQFEEELLKSMEIIESITGVKVCGHRACQASVMKSTSWSLDIMERCGIKYDSSVFPVKTPLYGVPDAPLFPYRISSENICGESEGGIYEFPLSVRKLPYKNIPIAGGFYLRLFPYWFIKNSIEKINKKREPAVIYLHPWEIDLGQPKSPEFKWYHYYNLPAMEPKIKQLLMDFKFTSIKKWLHG
ncbi:MAG: polysaccharide deacetylase family protein [Methanosarcina sp.]|uniref:polysaccharide deacetylase family protein n=1 Tax=Methanosarcina sp. TaxID=2213 RepID=UPI002606219D|nr:polysaccharide deacetylase family protein [Methanosarcina sp.]MDD3245389.1 polysaccharide deacetylase family protein [Methanosarcina sp.]MDD4247596.1 polysaccharide deacetylase family protein [Methanosarcina sp.]